MKTYIKTVALENIELQNEIWRMQAQGVDTNSVSAIQIRSIKMRDEEVIDFLEKKNELLEKTLANLKQYCSYEYVQASLELEQFLDSHKVSKREI